MSGSLDEDDEGIQALQRAAAHTSDPTPLDLVAEASVDPAEYLAAAKEIAAGASDASEAAPDAGGRDDDDLDAGDGAEGDLSEEAPSAVRGDVVDTREAYAGATAALSGEEFAPAWLTRQPLWVAWVLAYGYNEWNDPDVGPEEMKERKQPIAPHDRGDASPALWNNQIPDEDRPETSYDTAFKWRGKRIPLDLPAPERVTSDEVGVGVIIPVGGTEEAYGRPVVLIDWDDVRDPETGALHPECARALDELDCYAEVSQSGKGVHQFVFGEIPGPNSKFIRTLDSEPWVGDDAPAVEMYESGRLCALTFDHIEGTGRDVTEGQETVDRLCWEYGTGENNAPGTPADPYGRRTDGSAPSTSEVGEAMREAVAYDGPDPEEWDVPDGESLGYHAVLRAAPAGSDVEASNWELMGYAGTFAAHDGKPQSETVAELVEAGGYDEARVSSEVRRVYAKVEQGDYAPPSFATLARRGLLPQRFASTGPSAPGPVGKYGVEECAPPAVDRIPFDVDERRREMREERYEAFLDGGITIWGDEAGAGKTTTAARTAASLDRPHAIVFRNHRKARDFILDEPTPDDYYHLKGGPQKFEDACMDADHADEECPTHGHTSNCPCMCPVYDLPSDDDRRQQYEAVARWLGQRRAHQLFGSELPGHDDDGECEWLAQFDDAARAERLVAVHDYQTLKTVRGVEGGPARDVIVDETPRSLKDETRLSVADLAALASALSAVDEISGTPDLLGEFARFAEDVCAVVTGSADAPESLADLEAPAIPADAVAEVEMRVDPDNLPPDVDPEEVVRKRRREDVGMPEEGYRNVTEHVVEREHLAETLAQVKLEYGETILSRMREGEWNGEPLALDALLGAAAEAGLEETECYRAVSAPAILDGNCPRCGSALQHIDGKRVCATDDGCGWDEEHGQLVHPSTEPARAGVYTDRVRDESVRSADGAALVLETLPRADDLPDDPLVLDATATPAKVAAFYGVSEDDVRVEGDDPLEMPNLHTTQVLDGQYHGATIRESETARERIQQAITNTAALHESPLYVAKKGLLRLFDFPEDAEVVHYHAVRGLNFNECDAVVCIGAPHPDVEALRRDATLLARGRDVDVGGVEFSTRRDAANPPIYRKLDYTDENGRGRAVPTKHYSGLVGELFREGREKELIQVVHRIRALLAEETKHAYMLTNVPTALPVDDVVTFDELTGPLSASLPLSSGAAALLDALGGLARGEAPDGFRAESLLDADDGTVAKPTGDYDRLVSLLAASGNDDLDVSRQRVGEWVKELEEIGVFDEPEWRQHGKFRSVSVGLLERVAETLEAPEGFAVAAKRTLRAAVQATDSAEEWLRAVREVLTLGGPDDPGGGPPPGGSPAGE